jgi:diacylglycerol kinase (ATP)
MRVFVIVNFGDRPHCSHSTIKRIEQVFKQRHLDYSIELSTSIDHSRRLVARAEAEGFDTLLFGGGDGTINSLLNLVVGKPFTIGIVPLGTVNTLARTVGIPLDPVKACEFAVLNNARPVDIGKVNDRAFICFSSIGFDASVVHKVPEQVKVSLGVLAFFLYAIRQLGDLHNLPQFAVTLLPSGETHEGYSLILSNLRCYAGFNVFSLCVDSGDMELYIFKRNTIPDYLRYAHGLFFLKQNLSKIYEDVTHALVKSFKVTCEKPMFLQVDGEAASSGDNCQYTFEIIPHGINLIIPEPKAQSVPMASS